MERKRDLLAAGLDGGRLRRVPRPRVRTSSPPTSPRSAATDGVEFCLALPERSGVVAMPTQVFYDHPAAGQRLIRFAFCKRDEVLDDAVRRLTAS